MNNKGVLVVTGNQTPHDITEAKVINKYCVLDKSKLASAPVHSIPYNKLKEYYKKDLRLIHLEDQLFQTLPMKRQQELHHAIMQNYSNRYP